MIVAQFGRFLVYLSCSGSSRCTNQGFSRLALIKCRFISGAPKSKAGSAERIGEDIVPYLCVNARSAFVAGTKVRSRGTLSESVLQSRVCCALKRPVLFQTILKSFMPRAADLATLAHSREGSAWCMMRCRGGIDD